MEKTVTTAEDHSREEWVMPEIQLISISEQTLLPLGSAI